ncbi:hypothetical protein AXG93_4232s1010 [Marchantia polymorpha subsp. ruderalis]|uniref:Uncharacterized protein n=1 Tax=Marchantia polymorpha subsp. ruderalis TaxID=1480154 RepID=A0A176VQU8_MARPO|nr:hypothetical protein AXG93_4232s1010 [Marchantia polymorpha subsp. ruderalis]
MDAFGRSTFGADPMRENGRRTEGGGTRAFGTCAFGGSRSDGRSGLVRSRVPHRLRHFGREQCGGGNSRSGSYAAQLSDPPGNSVAIEILNSEDDGDESGSDEEEEQSVKGTPTTALCEQVVPLLRYLDRKVAKYADPRYPGSYVELVRRRTRTKVRTSSLLASLDEDIKDLQLKNNALRGHLAIVRKLQKVVNKTRDEKFEEAKKEFAKEQCGKLRAQRAEAELQLVVIEDDRRRATDRTLEELAERVNHYLRGYTLWEVATQQRIIFRELKIRAADLMSGDSRSRRRVAKRLDAFLARSRDAIANLEAEVTAVLRRLGCAVEPRTDRVGS